MSASRKQAKASDSSVASAVALRDRHQLIAMAAYFKAEARGFVPGHELEDWLAAEREFTPGVELVRH